MSKADREYLPRRGIKATISSKTDQDARRRANGSKGGRPPTFDPDTYRSATLSSAASIDSSATAPLATRYDCEPSDTKQPSTITAMKEWL